MFNGYSKKRKTSRPGKSFKAINKDESVDRLKNKNANKSLMNNVEITNFNGPSTSKAVINGMPITKRAKMIHVEKKDSSSSDEDGYSSIKNNTMNQISHNVQVRIRRVKPLLSGSEESRSKDSINKSETSKEVSNEEDGSHSNDSEDKMSEDDDVCSDVSEKNSNSDSDFKSNSDNFNKFGKKTVKCIYPRRRIIKDTDSENSKENLVNTQNASTKVVIKKNNGQRQSNNQLNLKKSKYPLRQVSKKNLAEVSSEGSNEEDNSYLKTRRSNQRLVNGTKSYAEHSNSDVSSDEEPSEDIDKEEEEEEDDDMSRKIVNSRISNIKTVEEDDNLSEEKEEESDSHLQKPSTNPRTSKQMKEVVDNNFVEVEENDVDEHSEEEEEEDVDVDEDSDNNYVPRPSLNSRNRKQRIVEDDNFDEDSDVYVPKLSVNSRNRKQRRKVEYDDDFDDEEDSDNYVPRPTVNSRKRRRSSGSVKRTTPASSGSDQGPKRKSLRSRKVRSTNESFSDSNDSESELKPAISISSRGRIRKLTPRARALQGVNL